MSELADEKYISDAQLENLLQATEAAIHNLKTAKNMTLMEIRAEFAGSVGKIQVHRLASGDGAALTRLMLSAVGHDWSAYRRGARNLLKRLTKEKRFRLKNKTSKAA